MFVQGRISGTIDDRKLKKCLLTYNGENNVSGLFTSSDLPWLLKRPRLTLAFWTQGSDRFPLCNLSNQPSHRDPTANSDYCCAIDFYCHTIMEFRILDQVCYECTDLHPMPLKGKCHSFCSRKAAQNQICKIAVRYDQQKFPIFSIKINWNPSDPCFFSMIYKCGR